MNSNFWIVDYIRSNTPEIFIDVGAKTGYIGQQASYAGAFTHFFEPDPKYAQMIDFVLDDADVNGKHSKMAISNFNGKATLYKSNKGLQILYSGDQVRVKCKKLDCMFHPDLFVNIDVGVHINVGGQELRVLEGMRDIVDSVDYVILEMHPDQNAFVEETIETITDYGLNEGKSMEEVYIFL